MDLKKRIDNNKEIIALIAIACLGVIAGSLIAPIESLFISSLTESKILLGLAFSVGTIFIFFFSFFIGRKSVTLGKNKLALLGLMAGIFYPLIYATSLNVFQYMFGRAAWALAGVSSGIILTSIFHDLISQRKDIARISGWKSSFQSICGTVAAIGGGALADVYGLKAPYYIVFFVYILAVLLFITFLYKREDKKVELKEEKQNVIVSLKNIYKNPFLFLRIFLEGITQSHWAMEPILFPLIIFNLTNKNIYTGLVFGLMGILAMIVLPIAGHFIDKNSPIKGLKIAFIIFTISFIILFLAKGIVMFIIGALLLSLGKSFNGPAETKIEVENIKTEYRGEYLSYIKMYDTLTAAFTCFLVGLLLKYFSPQTVLLLFAVFTAVGGFSGFILFYAKLNKFEYEQK